MSFHQDGVKITCDGYDCHASVRVPIGLSSLLGNPVKPAGWLYVNLGGRWMHFCDKCGRAVINVIQDVESPDELAAKLKAG